MYIFILKSPSNYRELFWGMFYM